jgi:hypothetical protein
LFLDGGGGKGVGGGCGKGDCGNGDDVVVVVVVVISRMGLRSMVVWCDILGELCLKKVIETIAGKQKGISHFTADISFRSLIIVDFEHV